MPRLRTTRPGVFAAGNVLHGAETADVAALDGRHVAAAVARHLDGEEWPAARVPIRCEPPLGWIAPNVIAAGSDGTPPRERFLLRSGNSFASSQIEIAQGGRTLWSGRLRRLGPGRSASLPVEWASAVDPHDGTVTVRRPQSD